MQIEPQLLLAFTNWANDRVLNGARQLNTDQLIAPIRPHFSSTLELLVHIMAAERTWLYRWKGESPHSLLGVEEVPTLDALQARWSPLRIEMLEFVTGITDPDYVVVYRTTKGVEFRSPLWPLFLHVINHGTEHRSQVALYLAMQDIDLGNLDLVYYLRENA